MYSCYCSNNWYQMVLNPEGAIFKVTQLDRMGNFSLWQMRVKDLLAQ